MTHHMGRPYRPLTTRETKREPKVQTPLVWIQRPKYILWSQDYIYYTNKEIPTMTSSMYNTTSSPKYAIFNFHLFPVYVGCKRPRWPDSSQTEHAVFRTEEGVSSLGNSWTWNPSGKLRPGVRTMFPPLIVLQLHWANLYSNMNSTIFRRIY